MDIILIYLITAGAIIFVLALVNVFLVISFYKTNSKIHELLGKGKIKDFKNILSNLKEKDKELEGEIKEAFLKIKNLDNTYQTTIRKIGVVRFNPFNNMGGNQSFVLAMLDNNNNGFIISSIFSEEGSRIYTKTIKKGKSDFSLSKEEIEAIEKAIDYNG